MTAAVLETLPPEVREGVRGLIQRSFPDPRCVPGDGLIGAFLAGLPEEAQLAVCGAKIAADILLDLTPSEDANVVCYYTASAVHERLAAPGKHAFVGTVPYVRVRLPEEAGINISTKLGIVFAGDHKLDCAGRVRNKYGFMLDYTLKRVELITPARYPTHFGSRFAAVAIYALYDESDTLRSHVLEAGMATGEAMVAFVSPNMNEIVRTSWYKPTPFSDERNTYVGTVGWSGDEIEQLHVDVFGAQPLPATDVHPAGDPHLRIAATFERLPAAPAAIVPAKLTAEAGLRIAAIAKARGSKDVLMLALAPFGEALPWIRKPEGV